MLRVSCDGNDIADVEVGELGHDFGAGRTDGADSFEPSRPPSLSTYEVHVYL